MMSPCPFIMLSSSDTHDRHTSMLSSCCHLVSFPDTPTCAIVIMLSSGELYRNTDTSSSFGFDCHNILIGELACTLFSTGMYETWESSINKRKCTTSCYHHRVIWTDTSWWCPRVSSSGEHANTKWSIFQCNKNVLTRLLWNLHSAFRSCMFPCSSSCYHHLIRVTDKPACYRHAVNVQ